MYGVASIGSQPCLHIMCFPRSEPELHWAYSMLLNRNITISFAYGLYVLQAPTHRQYRKFVGSKTTFRMINRNSVSVYSTGAYMERAFPLENGVTLVVSRIPGPMFEKLNKRMKAERPDVSVLYLSSHVINLARAIMVCRRFRYQSSKTTHSIIIFAMQRCTWKLLGIDFILHTNKLPADRFSLR